MGVNQAVKVDVAKEINELLYDYHGFKIKIFRGQ